MYLPKVTQRKYCPYQMETSEHLGSANILVHQYTAVFLWGGTLLGSLAQSQS